MTTMQPLKKYKAPREFTTSLTSITERTLRGELQWTKVRNTEHGENRLLAVKLTDSYAFFDRTTLELSWEPLFHLYYRERAIAHPAMAEYLLLHFVDEIKAFTAEAGKV